MIPSRRLVALALLPVAPLALAAWEPSWSAIAVALNLLLAALAVADLLSTPAPALFAVTREVPEVLSTGAPNPVRLHLKSHAKESVELELTDEVPLPSEATGLPLRLEIAPGAEASLGYHVVPQRRGPNRFSAVHLRYPSRLGLWTRQERRILESPVRIYPDIRAVRRFDLLARRNELAEIGLKFWRLAGREGEFERLREYRREDEPRHIDWKATAKYQKLVSRQFVVERNQNLFFLLDCGRTMANESEGLSQLDRGLNAAIILSYIALAQGDNVGLMAFSNRIELMAGPVRSKPQVQTLIRQTFDLQPRLEASDYGLACEELLRRQRKRALVVLLTHALDEHHLQSMGRYVRSITSPHLLLLVFLRNVALVDLASRVPADEAQAFHVAAAAEMLNAQRRAIGALRDAGAMVLDTLPGQLSAGLINQYLDIKARHML